MAMVYSREPKDCTPQQLSAFTKLVLAGGEVAAYRLPERIRAAAALAFLEVDGELAGVAGLKLPEHSYRAKVAQGAALDLPEER